MKFKTTVSWKNEKHEVISDELEYNCTPEDVRLELARILAISGIRAAEMGFNDLENAEKRAEILRFVERSGPLSLELGIANE